MTAPASGRVLALEPVDRDTADPTNMARVSRNFLMIDTLYLGWSVTIGTGAPPAGTPLGIYIDESGAPDVYAIT